MGKITQSQKVLNYISIFGSITSWEAMKDLGIMRLSARIWDLKKAGYRFDTCMERGKNRYGEVCYWKRYSLRKEAA